MKFSVIFLLFILGLSFYLPRGLVVTGGVERGWAVAALVSVSGMYACDCGEKMRLTVLPAVSIMF